MIYFCRDIQQTSFIFFDFRDETGDIQIDHIELIDPHLIIRKL